MTRPVFLDFETRSLADIKRCGGHAYVAHPTTEVVCGAASLPDGARWVWSRWPFLEPAGTRRGSEETPPEPVIEAALRHGVAAQNAEGFDRLVWEALGLPPVRWIDTAHRCAQRGLPRSLEKASQAALGEGKDRAGARLMRLISFPRKGALQEPVPALLTPFVRYCLRDVELLVRLWEQEKLDSPHYDDGPLLELDSLINRRGIAVDREWLDELARVNAAASEWAIAAAARWIEGGDPAAVLRSPQKLLKLLAKHGARAGDAQAGTMQALLLHEAPAVRALAAGRLAVARVLTGKIAAMQRHAPEGRLRGIFVYHSAHTGRWGASGPQLHNLPRVPKGASGLRPADAPAWAEERGVPVQDVLGSLVRGGLVPTTPGNVFVSGDFSAVEARGVLWLSDDPLLEEFRQSDRDPTAADPYMREAARLTGSPLQGREDPRRQLGKLAVLGCGYGGGTGALERSAEKQRVDLSAVDPDAVVQSWRDAHTAVAGTRTGGTFARADGSFVISRRGGWWQKLTKAIRRCLSDGGVRRAGRVAWERDGAHMVLHLPSGRRVLYREAKLELLVPPWGGEAKWHPTWLSPRGPRKLWHGLAAENCWTGDTLVVTCHGLRRIDSVTPGTLVWDGAEWVRTAGAVSRGLREVGTWAGLRVTREHKILAGESWRAVTRLDDRSTLSALVTGQDSVGWSWRPEEWGWPRGAASAAVAAPTRLRPSSSPASTPNAGSAPGPPGADAAPQPWDMPKSSPTSGCAYCGSTVSPASSPDAMTRGTQPTPATAAEGSASTGAGGTTGSRSCDTPSRSRSGTIPRSTSTGWTTTEATCPVTFGYAAGERTAATSGGPGASRSTGSGCPTRRSGPPTFRFGPQGPPGGIFHGGVPPSGSWTATSEPEEVWDLLDCGPRERFVVLTAFGPVLAHNCTQSTCRDLLTAALLRVEAAGFPVALHVHDSITVEAPPGSGPRVRELLCQPPAWAAGFPLAADVTESERFLK